MLSNIYVCSEISVTVNVVLLAVSATSLIVKSATVVVVPVPQPLPPTRCICQAISTVSSVL